MRDWGLALVVALTIGFVPALRAGRIVLHVDHAAAPGGNGTARFPFRDVQEAVAAAEATSEAVLIKVLPGDYVLTKPLVIDHALDLRGSTELIEGDDGWPTGDAVPGTETRIVAANPVGTQPLFVVGRGDASVLNDVSIEGFIFQGATNGIEVLLTRVQHSEVSRGCLSGVAISIRKR